MTLFKDVQWKKLPWETLSQGIMFVSLAMLSFTMSFGQLRAWAETLKMQPATLYPIVLDLGAVAFSVCAYIGAMRQREMYLARFLVWVWLALSVVFQLMQAVIDQSLQVDWRDATMYVKAAGHAVVPLATVLNLEVLLGAMLKSHRESIKRQKQQSRMQRVNDAKKVRRLSDSEIHNALSSAKTKKAAAEKLGVSVATIYRRVTRRSA